MRCGGPGRPIWAGATWLCVAGQARFGRCDYLSRGRAYEEIGCLDKW